MDEPQIDREQLLVAAAWILDHMRDPEVSMPVRSRLAAGGHTSFTDWVKADPQAVLVMHETLADLGDQDATFERDILGVGKDVAPVVDEEPIIDWGELCT